MILMRILEWFGVGCPESPETWTDRTACAFAEQGALAVAPLLLGILLMGTLIAAIFRRWRQNELQGADAFLYSDAPPAVHPSKRAPRAHEEGVPPDADRPRHATPPPERDRGWMPGGDPPSPSPQKDSAEETPVEGTLQLLPGRIELTNGGGKRKEVRFVRVPGTAPEVSFGRVDGLPHRHVQLSSPTVSRRHARMRFDGKRWLLVNESTTNPTRVNGRAVDAAAGELPLGDGDRIEMGEVEMIFRQDDVQDRLPLRSSWYTDRGRRASNQDAVAVRTLADGRELAVVCDGMGGHAAGAVASHTALEALVNTLEDSGKLQKAVSAANAAVRREAAEDPGKEGMGTTMVALLREGDAYWVANIGDSRAYRVDADGLRRITEDHSFVAEVVRNGRMSSEEAERSPWRNALTRHLGADDDVKVDVYGPYTTTDDHTVILCSDGVHGILSETEIEDLVRDSADVRDLARDAGEAALRRGGDDNVGVAAVQFGQRAPAVAPANETA